MKEKIARLEAENTELKEILKICQKEIKTATDNGYLPDKVMMLPNFVFLTKILQVQLFQNP